MRVVIALSAAAMLIGCSTSEQWVSAQRSNEEAALDRQECQHIVEELYPRREVLAVGAPQAYDHRLSCGGSGPGNQCSTVRVATPNYADQFAANTVAARDQTIADGARKTVISRGVFNCMKAKGYALSKD